MYDKYFTNTKVKKLSQDYLNSSIHSYKSNKKKQKPSSITKTPLNQRNLVPNQKPQGVYNPINSFNRRKII